MEVSGCQNDCAGGALHDLGMIASNGGWRVMVGGNGGRTPRVGTEIASGLDRTEATALLAAALRTYQRLANERERIGALIERIGLSVFRRELAAAP